MSQRIGFGVFAKAPPFLCTVLGVKNSFVMPDIEDKRNSIPTVTIVKTVSIDLYIQVQVSKDVSHLQMFLGQ